MSGSSGPGLRRALGCPGASAAGCWPGAAPGPQRTQPPLLASGSPLFLGPPSSSRLRPPRAADFTACSQPFRSARLTYGGEAVWSRWEKSGGGIGPGSEARGRPSVSPSAEGTDIASLTAAGAGAAVAQGNKLVFAECW